MFATIEVERRLTDDGGEQLAALILPPRRGYWMMVRADFLPTTYPQGWRATLYRRGTYRLVAGELGRHGATTFPFLRWRNTDERVVDDLDDADYGDTLLDLLNDMLDDERGGQNSNSQTSRALLIDPVVGPNALLEMAAAGRYRISRRVQV